VSEIRLRTEADIHFDATVTRLVYGRGRDAENALLMIMFQERPILSGVETMVTVSIPVTGSPQKEPEKPRCPPSGASPCMALLKRLAGVVVVQPFRLVATPSPEDE
jgi:hypothetical protein